MRNPSADLDLCVGSVEIFLGMAIPIRNLAQIGERQK
jgi:hypothetical protein